MHCMQFHILLLFDFFSCQNRLTYWTLYIIPSISKHYRAKIPLALLFLHAFAHACHLSLVFLLPSGVWFFSTLQSVSWGLDVTKSIKTTFQIGLDISGFRLSASPYVMAFHVAVQGHLHTYRFCDNVWTFILTDATFKSEEISETLSKVKIVACDSKLLQPHQP